MVSGRVVDRRFEISNLDLIKDMDRINKPEEVLSIMEYWASFRSVKCFQTLF
jgi:hypothetical protein